MGVSTFKHGSLREGLVVIAVFGYGKFKLSEC